MIRVLLASALAGLGFGVQDPGEVELSWPVSAGEAYVYNCFDLSSGKPADEKLIVFGSELATNGSNSIGCRGSRDIPIVLLFMLPGKKVSKGSSWRYERDFFGTPVITSPECEAPLRRIRVQGQIRVSDIRDGRVETLGSFQLYVGAEGKSGWVPFAKPAATVETRQIYDSRSKALDLGTYVLSGTLRDLTTAEKELWPSPQLLRISRRIERLSETWRLREDVSSARVEAALKNGRDWLAKQQQGDGHFEGRAGGYWGIAIPKLGPTAFAISALLHAGLRPDDPVVQRAWTYLVAKANAIPPEVYEISSCLLALEARYRSGSRLPASVKPEDCALLEKWAKWLVDAMHKPLPKVRRALTWEDDVFLLTNHFYAALGLRAAARLGFKIRGFIWKELLNRVGRTGYEDGDPIQLKLVPMPERELAVEPKRLDSRFTPGSWGICTFGATIKEVTGTGFSTCPALAVINICESELSLSGELEQRDAKLAQDAKCRALAWLQSNFSVRAVQPEAGHWSTWHLYYLFSLGEALESANVKEIGGHDWYLEGASYLLATQHPDGSWNSPADVPTMDTCFALLFLKRGLQPTRTKSEDKKKSP